LLSVDDVQKEMHEAQISKLHAEMSRLRELLVECRGKERETQSIVSDLQMSLTDLQSLVRLIKLQRNIKDLNIMQILLYITAYLLART